MGDKVLPLEFSMSSWSLYLSVPSCPEMTSLMYSLTLSSRGWWRVTIKANS